VGGDLFPQHGSFVEHCRKGGASREGIRQHSSQAFGEAGLYLVLLNVFRETKLVPSFRWTS
jgi:hypothetical protein